MVFSSHIFFYYFLPLTLAIYLMLPMRGKHISLTLLSYLFYGWANPWFVVLMLVQTVIDYVAGMTIAQQWGQRGSAPVELLSRHVPRSGLQKTSLALALISNLAMLGFFKYFNFGIDTYNSLATSMGFDHARWDTVFRVTLPLGISFYTFQSMSYSIDVYRGDARAIRSILDYMCYVAMFPQLVAGPIVRFQDVSDQFLERTHTFEKFGRGVAFVSFGLAKKILIANPCGKIADTVFDAATTSTADAWYGVTAYAFQIYFDFSAYSDMAIGLGLMTGFVFAKNFDSPYKSQSITEFWRRWHLSLSTWLRDNLYIPLGGSRRGEVRTYFNLAIVMLLGGLWHGASWNFVIWGGIHGGMLGFERLQGKDSLYRRMPSPIRTGLTFVIILFTWVFFRASDLTASTNYIRSMLGVGVRQDGTDLIGGLIYHPYYLGSVLLAGVIVWGCPQTWDFTRRITWPKAAFCVVTLALSLLVMEAQAFNPFIYFIF